MTAKVSLIILCIIIGIRAGFLLYESIHYIAGIITSGITERPDIESFSIYRKELYDSKESDDEFYNRFDK